MGSHLGSHAPRSAQPSASVGNAVPVGTRLKHWTLHAAGRFALRRFQRGLPVARSVNAGELRNILARNAATDFGRQHDFASVLASADPLGAFRKRVPLATYEDLMPYVERIKHGEESVLTSDPVHMLAGSSGTTGSPKRIPRTRRAQRHHLSLVVLAEQAVIDRDIAGAREPRRGINLMSLAASPAPEASAVPILAGPNAGMARLQRLIPLLWCAPAAVYAVADSATALYLQALSALKEADALYIETPFAPQITGWFALMEQHHQQLLNDLATGTLAPHLALTPAERTAIGSTLTPDPGRAAQVAEHFAAGSQGIIPRLWPDLRYLRTVTSGSFALSLPRLRWLTGPELPIHSGCHSSSEGIIGINLRADGSTDYVLAIGTAFFEFIPLSYADARQPPIHDLAALEVGRDYELVITSSAGLYRYRLGDVIRITGWVGEAPTFQFCYRRGTLLNLVGEKTSEQHTARALVASLRRWLEVPDPVKDYTVAGHVGDGCGRYTFYVELDDRISAPSRDLTQPIAWLDEALGHENPYYLSSGRQPCWLAAPDLKLLRSGAFDALLALQAARAAPVTSTQLKVPRTITTPEQLQLLESFVDSQCP
ncbi:MAG: hypothetical protein DYH20_07240 [Gammaproteobacteria bacterium PRO9]|nr:hypothetical protein [Gammaproteobacteria bacterium PRO9]